MSSGAAALSLCNYNGDERVHHPLARFEDVSDVAETAALGLYLGTARKQHDLLRGKQSRLFLFAAVAIGFGGADAPAPQQIASASLGRGSAPYRGGWIGTALTGSGHALTIGEVTSVALPPRSMVGQLPLEQHIGVRIPGGQPLAHFPVPSRTIWFTPMPYKSMV